MGIIMLIKKFGEWRNLPRYIEQQTGAAFKGSEEILEEVARMYYDSIMELIANGGDGSWKPLSEDWIRKKGHSGFYQESGQFVGDIVIEWISNTIWNKQIFVGVPYKGIHDDITYERLLAVLEEEYERPLFSPAYERIEHKIKERLVKLR
jgi:hypothetical protein